MSSANSRLGAHPKPGQPLASAMAPSSQAILLDKLNVRQSTPDSEALASSDEEFEHHRQAAIAPSTQQQHPQKPVRRASWLTETSQAPSNLVRKGSFASSSMSPTTSHPPTPSAEAGAWGSLSASSAGLPRGPAGTSSFPWGSNIWNSERKDAPSRLAEVMSSPTTAGPMSGSSNGLHQNDTGLNQMSPKQRDQPSNSQIPFQIPLHPTPKAYRSQSYSVGQMEADAIAESMGPSRLLGSRVRTIPHAGLQHRPSRPSMLSEMANDGSSLGKVNEDDDDDSAGSLHNSQHQSAEAKIEMLTRENALLRQQQQQLAQSSRLRPRASTGLGGYMHEPVPEESEYAVDEMDEANEGSDVLGRRALGRRMSEFGVSAFRSPFENRKLENVKKGIWQSQQGFSAGGDISQSRRHSFADVPVFQRQGSIVSLNESVASQDTIGQESHFSQDPYPAFANESNFGAGNPAPHSYFGSAANFAPSQQAVNPSPYGHYPYALPQGLYSNRSVSPHRGMYGHGMQPRQNQLLHIVVFKCFRPDVFYIQEGTGLTVKEGDLVIVEADRGTDLGTVAKENVDWQTARDLKEKYAEEQYKWLMMYSQNAAAAGDGAGAGLMAASSGAAAAVGGMGPPNPHHVQDPNPGELRPKLIKRLAQAHEIAALKDKEGSEAKAKRICMTKVKDHGLNMEILDAEFQMDWKKLTFYYFADSYINFNSLVTDLFKIYKTRIWMSAINPASFANPTLGLQPPSGIGPGAVGVGRNGQERRQNTAASSEQGPSLSSQTQSLGQRVIRPSNSHGSFTEQSVVSPPTYGAAPAQYAVYNPYNQFGVTRPGAVPYAQNMMQPMEPFHTGYSDPAAADYQMGRGRYQLNPAGNGLHGQSGSPLPMGSQTDWTAAFQGLSLNGR